MACGDKQFSVKVNVLGKVTTPSTTRPRPTTSPARPTTSTAKPTGGKGQVSIKPKGAPETGFGGTAIG